MMRYGGLVEHVFLPPGIARLLIVVVGGIVVLQSSPNLDPWKLAYLALAGTATLFSCRSVWVRRDSTLVVAGRPWIVTSVLLLTLVALSLPVALANGTPLSQWFRDAAAYGLLAVAPIVALDASDSGRSDLLLAITVVTGALAAGSLALFWIDVRNPAELAIQRLVLPTAGLSITLFLVTVAAAITGRPNRAAWILAGGLTLGSFLVTGTRSSLFLLISLPIMVIVAGRDVLVRSAVSIAGVSVVAVAFVVIFQGAFVGDESGSVPPPIDLVPRESAGGAPLPTQLQTQLPTPLPPLDPDATLVRRLERFLNAPLQDPSLRERISQYRVAWDLFLSSPIMGQGLGRTIEWTRVDGTVLRAFTADTPVVLLAKLGLLGMLWLVSYGVVWFRFVRRLRREAGLTIPGLALTGWAAVLVALAWTGFFVEDKGFSFAMMLLLSLGFIEIGRAAAPGSVSPAPSFADDGEFVTTGT
jgi:O-antigen ligase